MYVRDCANKVGMDDRHVRVASQGRDLDTRLVEALRVLLRP
jgi:histidinol-phosphate/aromatic aminotransferase/cobyric acid decarboxylase-like protein